MTKQPWDIRDPSPRGESDENAIFNAVGRALTEWETLEVECAKLFAVFVSANHKRSYHAPAVRAYGAITSADTRFKMLQLASESYFAKRPAKRASFEKKCDGMLGEYKQYKDRRNEIAHGLVQKVFITGKTTPKGTRQGAIGLYLMPSFYNPKKFKDEKFTYRYVSGDVIHYKQEFTKLCWRIGGLREQLAPSSR
jgi:hypothetical protein